MREIGKTPMPSRQPTAARRCFALQSSSRTASESATQSPYRFIRLAARCAGTMTGRNPSAACARFYGNTGMFIRALAYILANGPDGLRQTTEDAVLNANYIRKKLEDVYELPYKTASMHEVVFSDKRQAARGVKTGDIAKRLIDYGFHPYTVSFPLIVHGALMIEPTESESREELDLFIAAMRSIAREVEENPELVKTAPHSTRVSRLDEVQAARKPILRWRPQT